MSWQIDDVSFDLVGDLTEGPVMTIRVSTPDGSLVMMAEPEESGRTLTLRRFNAEGMAANALGPANLRAMADVLMERMDYDELIIEGTVRTSGANPGRRPSPVRFARRPVPAPCPKPGKR